MINKPGAASGLTAAAGSHPDRKIKVRMWIQAWGQQIEKIAEVSSPPVSNQPCLSLQRESDLVMARMAISFGHETGFEILSENSEHRHADHETK